MASQNSLVVKLPYSSSSAAAINKATQAASSEDPRTAASAPSSKQVAPIKITKYFSPGQLALALAIQKAKPEALSTSKYCQQLQEVIKTGQPMTIDGLRYIDTCEFWKDQYTKIHLENKALQDKVHMLEQEKQNSVEHLYGKGNHGNEIVSNPPLSEPRELGRADHEASRKRPLPTEEDRAVDKEQDYIDFSSSEDNSLRMSAHVLRIGRQRNNLEKAAQDSSTLNHVNILAKSISHTLVLLESALSDTCLPLKLLRDDSEDHRISNLIQQVMHQVRTSFISCFKSTTDLCLTIPGRERNPEIVYRMVMFFNKALKLLHSICKMQAESEVVRDNQRPRRKRSRVEEREYLVTKALASSLASIAYGIEWKVGQTGHADLLEGILFCIMEQTGRLLSEAVFAEHVAASDNPGNISKTEDRVPSGSVKHESRYMVQILQAALGSVTRRNLIAQVLALGKSSSVQQAHVIGSSLSSTPPSDLLTKARKLLQNTMVKCAVGGSDLETLRLPTPPIEEVESPIEVDEEVEKYGSEWLVHSVWGIISWDMIA